MAKHFDMAETLRVRLTFTEEVLGQSPSSKKLYEEFIASKAPDAMTTEDEIEAYGVDKVMENSTTIFNRDEDGQPFLYDYQIKGFFKDSCGGLRKAQGTASSRIKAYKKDIDRLIFPAPRRIPFENYGEIGRCQRPKRTSSPQGEFSSLAISEEIAPGATLTFTISMFSADYEAAVREWLDYGRFSGLGQWRNSGKGRFTWEELPLEG